MRTRSFVFVLLTSDHDFAQCGGTGGAEFGNIVTSGTGEDCGYFRIRRGDLGIEQDVSAGMVTSASGHSNTCTEACGASTRFLCGDPY
jgi:hypothetical protein